MSIEAEQPYPTYSVLVAFLLLNKEQLFKKNSLHQSNYQSFTLHHRLPSTPLPTTMKSWLHDTATAKVNVKQSAITAFWKDDAHPATTGDRKANALKAHQLRHGAKKHLATTSSSYRVKYTVMSKESKHFLELVVMKLLHCWRKYQSSSSLISGL